LTTLLSLVVVLEELTQAVAAALVAFLTEQRLCLQAVITL
jgi:hypothetical protein